MARTLPNPIVTKWNEKGDHLTLDATAVQANFDDLSANADPAIVVDVFTASQVSPDTGGASVSPGSVGAGRIILVIDAAVGTRARMSDGSAWINLG